MEIFLEHIYYIVATFAAGVMAGWITYPAFKKGLAKKLIFKKKIENTSAEN